MNLSVEIKEIKMLAKLHKECSTNNNSCMSSSGYGA